MEEWSFGMTGEWSTLPGGKHECSYAIRTLHFASPGSMAPLGSTGTAHLRKMQSRVRRPHVGQDAIPAPPHPSASAQHFHSDNVDWNFSLFPSKDHLKSEVNEQQKKKDLLHMHK